MTERRLLVGLAVVGLVAGIVAVATGGRAPAIAAGAASVGVACVAMRSIGHRALTEPPRVPLVEPLPDLQQTPPAAPSDPPRRRASDTEVEIGPFGMFGPALLDATIRNRVAVARRALRPLAIVHFEVFDADGDHAMPVPIEAVAAAMDDTLRESDVAGSRADGVFAFVLEETAEDGAVWTAERLRRRLVAERSHRRFRAGIAAYPTHGLDADAVDAKAAEALRVARDWKRDRIEVATGI